MPTVKPVTGHTSCKGVINYLTKDGRALASDYVNCTETRFVDDAPVWKVMDETRAALGTDKPYKGKPARTYDHYIISPDPRDVITLDQLRELTMMWVEKYYSAYQVAIYYHDDNEGGIMHAHVVVNNANLETGGRLSLEYKRNGEWTRRVDDLQVMARDMGLRYQVPTDAPKRGAFEPNQGTYRTKEERSMRDQGKWLWKEDVRGRISCAMRLSRTPAEFLVVARALGLQVYENKNHDWTFVHPGKDTWRVTGKRLGADWSRIGIERRLTYERARGVNKLSAASVARILDTFSTFVADGAETPQVLGIISGRSVSADEVLRMLTICSVEDIRSMDDFADAARKKMIDKDRDAFNSSWLLARELSFLPEHRQKSDGPRTPAGSQHGSRSTSGGSGANRTGGGFGVQQEASRARDAREDAR